jgi:hypothetical protein
VIMHLEHAIEMQDLELEEREVMIAALEQQLQAPLTPEAPAKPDVVSNVDEE